MALSILTNPVSIFAQGSVNRATNNLEKSIRQLSTGLRINSASDDPAGFAISEKLRVEISGLKSTTQNMQSGQSMLSVADSYMSSIISRMADMSALVDSATGSNADKSLIQSEIDNLKNEINVLSNSAEFNSRKLLNGNAAALWSSTNSNTIQGIITGDMKNGIYNVTVGSTGTAGTNSIYAINFTAGTTGTTLLKDTKLFSGNNIPATTQTISIFGNGKSIDITFDETMTVDALASAFNSAISQAFGTTATNQAVFSGGATRRIIFQSTVLGDAGNILVSGNNNVVTALGIETLRTGTAQTYNVTITGPDGTTKNYSTVDGVISGAINGANIKLDLVKMAQTSLLDANNLASGAILKLAENTATITFKNNSSSVQLPSGSNINLAIGQMNTTSLGLDNVNVMFDPLIAKDQIDKAMNIGLRQVSDLASKNRSLSTMQDMLNVTTENLVAARSRIVDLDMAEATSIYASRQVILQAANAMLAQANLIPSYALQLLRQA